MQHDPGGIISHNPGQQGKGPDVRYRGGRRGGQQAIQSVLCQAHKDLNVCQIGDPAGQTVIKTGCTLMVLQVSVVSHA